MCKYKKWAEVGRDLGYSGKIMSSLSTSLKNSYQKWLHPYEEYLRIAKPGVHQQLEYENGGPFTPSPAPSPMKHVNPSLQGSDSPAIRASAALNATLQQENLTATPEPSRPVLSSGFTAVNSGGFTAVNAPTPSIALSTPTTNISNGIKREVETSQSTPQRSAGSPLSTVDNTPDSRLATAGPTPQPNSLKRPLSLDGEGAANGDSDGTSRRSKRQKKGTLCILLCRFHWWFAERLGSQSPLLCRHQGTAFAQELR